MILGFATAYAARINFATPTERFLVIPAARPFTFSMCFSTQIQIPHTDSPRLTPSGVSL